MVVTGRAHHRRDDTSRCINFPDDVIFGIGDEHMTPAIDGQAFRLIEGSLRRRPAVAGIARLAASSKRPNGP